MFCRCERSRRSCHREDNAGSTNSCAVIGATLCHFEGLDLWASESRNKYRYRHKYKYNWKFKKNKHSSTLGDLIFETQNQGANTDTDTNTVENWIEYTLWGISFVASKSRNKNKYKYKTQCFTLRDCDCEHQNGGINTNTNTDKIHRVPLWGIRSVSIRIKEAVERECNLTMKSRRPELKRIVKQSASQVAREKKSQARKTIGSFVEEFFEAWSQEVSRGSLLELMLITMTMLMMMVVMIMMILMQLDDDDDDDDDYYWEVWGGSIVELTNPRGAASGLVRPASSRAATIRQTQ